MKINKNNFWITMHEDFYEQKPKTLCGFFWKTLLVFLLWITSPISLVFSIIESIKEKKLSHVTIPAILVIDKLIQMFALIWILPINDNQVINWSKYPIMYLLTIVIIFLILGIGWVLNKLWIKYCNFSRTKKYNKVFVEKKPNVMIEAFKAIKSKICPIIEYTED